MPIYMDIHLVPGVKAEGVAEAHRQDLLIQDANGCKCMTYWVDELRETVFCLIEAPDKDAVKNLHKKSHGLIPSKVIEVSSDTVQSFLGRIYDPEDADETESGLKIIAEPSFRVLLLTYTEDVVVLTHRLGGEEAAALLQAHNKIIRDAIMSHGGSEVEQGGSGFIISFSSATQALSCALAIQNKMGKTETDQIDFKMSINGGEPIEKSATLFGDTVKKGNYLSKVVPGGLVIASSLKDLLLKEQMLRVPGVVTLTPPDEMLLECLFDSLEAHWQDPEFDVENYCHKMAMSKSQLYRKCLALTGLSPNLLLKDFRLDKAKSLIRHQHQSISQVSFECGFTSPSYFTKCFKKKYGLLPLSYLEMCRA